MRQQRTPKHWPHCCSVRGRSGAIRQGGAAGQGWRGPRTTCLSLLPHWLPSWVLGVSLLSTPSPKVAAVRRGSGCMRHREWSETPQGRGRRCGGHTRRNATAERDPDTCGSPSCGAWATPPRTLRHTVSGESCCRRFYGGNGGWAEEGSGSTCSEARVLEEAMSDEDLGAGLA